ncbi:MAG: hypothetical protein LBG92_09240 [Prevotellaceae bacterium]|jgi:hypothetical protein|nr:hypothetical protein [Prevotellaceae bacterium]
MTINLKLFKTVRKLRSGWQKYQPKTVTLTQKHPDDGNVLTEKISNSV